MYGEPSLYELVLIAAIILGATARTYLERDEEDPADEAKRLYAEGQIDEPELERRIDEAVDDEFERIRLIVEDVNGVGPQTSKAIAREYATLEDLRGTDWDRLEAVYGVGEETAEAVLERVRE
ncbi:helix-hairpin-helix domain-containing protein [Natrinema thermotolerans]